MVKKATLLKIIKIGSTFYGKINSDFARKYKIKINDLLDADIDVKEELK